MKICIMHFVSSLLRIFLAKILFQEFLYEVLLVLSRWCFHHLVENSVLYKKDIQHFYIGPIFFSENKIIRSVLGGKVDDQILFCARSEKPKILFDAKWQLRKIYLAVKELSSQDPPQSRELGCKMSFDDCLWQVLWNNIWRARHKHYT